MWRIAYVKWSQAAGAKQEGWLVGFIREPRLADEVCGIVIPYGTKDFTCVKISALEFDGWPDDVDR